MTLPPGFRVHLAPGVLTADAGRVLVGGSPLTAMRLTRRAHDHLRNGSVTVTDEASALLAERLLATNLGQPDLSHEMPVDGAGVTVVIPVRDRPHQLDRALGALHPLHCIVVDDQSLAPQPVADVARRHGADLIPLRVNVGPAGARNAGLASVTTPYVAFVDSDVEVTAANLLALTRHFADPAVSLVGPRVAGIARSARPRWFETYDAAAASLTLGTTPGVVRPGAAVAAVPAPSPTGSTGSTTACGSARTSTWSGASSRAATGSATTPPSAPTTTPEPPSVAGSAASTSMEPAAPISPHATATSSPPPSSPPPTRSPAQPS